MHFTYKERAEGDLHQGDLLRISEELKATLKEFYPYYYDHSDYRYLMVTTQSCDLFRAENGKCKSRYITLVAVRPLKTAINRFLDDSAAALFETEPSDFLRACPISRKAHIEDFIRKLFNNNWSKYFFLAEDSDYGIHEPHVAFLHLSITLKANEHYKNCLDARVLQLEDIFQSKLGWLVGNTYSRVGTKDWVPTKETEEQFDERIEKILNDTCIWVPDNVIKKIKKKYRKILEEKKVGMLKKEEVMQLFNDYQNEQTNKRQRGVDIIIEHIRSLIPGACSPNIEKITERLRNDPNLNISGK